MMPEILTNIFAQAIRENRAIRCPLCRKVHTQINLATLPNNNYALQVAKLAREKKQLESLLRQNETSRDSLLSSTADDFSALKTQLGKMRERRQTNLIQAIEMRKEISAYLLLVLDSVKNVEKEIAGQVEENERFLTDLISLYEGGNKLANVSDESSGEASNVTDDMSELESLMSSCQLMRCPDDTEETIKEKMSQSVEKSHDKLKLATCQVTQLHKWKNASFVLKAQGPGSVSLFNSTIKIDWATTPFSSKDLNHLLLSHLICYVIKPVAATTDGPNASSGFNLASLFSIPAESNRRSSEADDSYLASRLAELFSDADESTESSSEYDGTSISSDFFRRESFNRSDESRFGSEGGFGTYSQRERRWIYSSNSD
jgi:hypothetical protein